MLAPQRVEVVVRKKRFGEAEKVVAKREIGTVIPFQAVKRSY